MIDSARPALLELFRLTSSLTSHWFTFPLRHLFHISLRLVIVLIKWCQSIPFLYKILPIQAAMR